MPGPSGRGQARVKPLKRQELRASARQDGSLCQDVGAYGKPDAACGKAVGPKSNGPRKTKPGTLSPGRQPPSSSGPNQRTATKFTTTRLTDPPPQLQQMKQTCKDLPSNHSRLQKRKTTNQRVLPTPSNHLQPTREKPHHLPAQPRRQSNRDRSQRSSGLCSNLLKEPKIALFNGVRGFHGISVPGPGRPPTARSENGFRSFQKRAAQGFRPPAVSSAV
jgi:hypothetical protein